MPPRRAAPLALLAVAAALTLAWHGLPLDPHAVETVYSRVVYPTIARLVVTITGAVPFSLSATVLVVAPLALLWWLRSSWRARRNLPAFALHVVTRSAATVLLLYGAFLFSWGLNYGRQDVETLFGLSRAPVTAPEVEALSRELLAIVLRDMPSAYERDGAAALASLRSSMQDVVRDVTGVTPALPHDVKRLPGGALLTFGSSGIAVPILLEPHIDAALPEAHGLAVATHELAHIAGFAGEADADLLTAVAGLRAQDPYARYAVALWLLSQTGRQLPRATWAELHAALPADAMRDLREAREAARTFHRPVTAAATQVVYNQYLVAQRVESGIRDYSRIVALLATAHRDGLVPTPGSTRLAAVD